MKLRTLFLLLTLCYCFVAKSQVTNTQSKIDSTLAKKITVSGFCLCAITLNDLKKLANDFKPVEVEEMDLGKTCIATDSRFENGKGYYSEKYPGLIFQKDDYNFISKIRMTKDFNGKLPDGTPIELKNLLLRDVIKLYPQLNSKWGSRGCSDYWSFSNDTLAFFVKIDKTKKPQFPIDEKFYLDKPIAGIDLMISCYSLFRNTNEFVLFSPDDPIFFVDSIRVNRGVLETYQPTEFAMVSVYKDSSALRVAGNDAKNGAIYITTKAFAREHYWKYLISKSEEYRKAVPSITVEVEVAYILNGKFLESDFEKDLFEIDDSNFIELNIIKKDKLQKDYGISDKSIGVIIKTKK